MNTKQITTHAVVAKICESSSPRDPLDLKEYKNSKRIIPKAMLAISINCVILWAIKMLLVSVFHDVITISIINPAIHQGEEAKKLSFGINSGIRSR